MDKRIPAFNEYFTNWDIALPGDAEERYGRGRIHSRGWIIKFDFGEDGDGKFLDFYEGHRMTSDRHMRLRENGDAKWLPAYPDVLVRASREHLESVTELLEAKGFGIGGDGTGPLLTEEDLRTGEFGGQAMTTIRHRVAG